VESGPADLERASFNVPRFCSYVALDLRICAWAMPAPLPVGSHRFPSQLMSVAVSKLGSPCRRFG
jgi:hypothetical protein